MPEPALVVWTTKGSGWISPADADLLHTHCWFIGTHGYFTGYRRGSGRRGCHDLLHRVVLERALGSAPTKRHVADHRNGDKRDNRRSNLRWVTPRQSSWNGRGHSKTGYKGVERTGAKRPRYAAYITIQGSKQHLGCFDTPEEAARVYDHVAAKVSRGYARLNFPETADA